MQCPENLEFKPPVEGCPIVTCKWNQKGCEGQCLALERKELVDNTLSVEEIAHYRGTTPKKINKEVEEARNRIRRLLVFNELWEAARTYKTTKTPNIHAVNFMGYLAGVPHATGLFKGPLEIAARCLLPAVWRQLPETKGLEHHETLFLTKGEHRELYNAVWKKPV